MLIFPSWLYHSVAPNMAQAAGPESDRVIVSFNMEQVSPMTDERRISLV